MDLIFIVLTILSVIIYNNDLIIRAHCDITRHRLTKTDRARNTSSQTIGQVVKKPADFNHFQQFNPKLSVK